MRKFIFFVILQFFFLNTCIGTELKNKPEKDIKIDMVRIKAGKFEAKPLSAVIDKGIIKKTWLKINLTKDYLIGKYEISQKQWLAVMGKWSYYEILEIEKRPSWEDYYLYPPIGDIERIAYGDDYPVYGITWMEACEFCNKLSILHGFEPCYEKLTSDCYKWNTKANGYRLPTAAEWEYADGCGTNKNSYFWGDEFDERYAFPELTLEEKRFSQKHAYTEVNKNLPNDFGLHNTVGNVWELCWDEDNPNNYAVFLVNGEYLDPHSDPDYNKLYKDSDEISICQKKEWEKL